MTSITGDDLAPVLAAFAAGSVDGAALQAAFDAATLFVQRVPGGSDHPGGPALAAVGPPGAGYVVVHASLRALAAYAGPGDWASAPGADLLDLVPPGYGLLVDPAGPYPAVLPASALRRGRVLSAVRR
jgi:hypothetical protein